MTIVWILHKSLDPCSWNLLLTRSKSYPAIKFNQRTQQESSYLLTYITLYAQLGLQLSPCHIPTPITRTTHFNCHCQDNLHRLYQTVKPSMIVLQQAMELAVVTSGTLKTCKAPVKSPRPPTYQQWGFFLQVRCPCCCPINSVTALQALSYPHRKYHWNPSTTCELSRMQTHTQTQKHTTQLHNPCTCHRQ